MDSRSLNLPQLRKWLLEADDTPLLDLARKKKSILSRLTALSYDSDPAVSQRAIQWAGTAAQIIAERDPEYIRNTLLRLFWLVNDESGGIGWRAPELIGEILFHCPQFKQFFPMLVSLLDLEKEDAPRFQAGTLWAIGRVAQADREGMLTALRQVQSYLSAEQPGIKEMAAWCTRQLVGDEA